MRSPLISPLTCAASAVRPNRLFAFTLAVAALLAACAACAVCTGCSLVDDQPTRRSTVSGGARTTPAPSGSAQVGSPAVAPARSAPPTGRAAASASPVLGLWINRWDYKTPADIETAMERAASLNITDVFWQVRGQADAFYPSALEPWGEEICVKAADGSLKPPSFDPLRVAIDAAHKRGLRLHAWMNVMPVWKGTKEPRSRQHMYHRRPEWRLVSSDGRMQPLNDHYVTINFTLPEVQDHLVAVARDLSTRYAIDGLHMDYVRFVAESANSKDGYLDDPATLDRFAREVGIQLTRENLPQHRARKNQWRRDKITAIARRIAAEVRAARPGIEITAAVWRTPASARGLDQDAALWLNEGTLDRAYPMIYTAKDDDFRKQLGEWLAEAPNRAVCPGLGIYMHAPGESAYQVSLSRKSCPAGFALYAYASLFESADPTQDKSAKAVRERAARLVALRSMLTTVVRER